VTGLPPEWAASKMRGGSPASTSACCVMHAPGGIVESRPGFDNILLVQRLVDGKLRTVTCRRYDRATDSFVDVDPRSLGIQEE
jgi:hypothetical protein